MIREVLMAAGSGTIALHPHTPKAVLDRFEWLSLVTITAAHIPADAMSTSGLLGAAMYTGVYMGRSDRRTTLDVYGAASLLGGPGGLGNVFSSDQTINETSIENAVEAYVLRESVGNPVANGISQGALDAGAVDVDASINAGDSPLDALNAIYLAAGGAYKWRINPDLTLDMDDTNSLFRDREAIFNPWWSGRDRNVTGYRCEIDPRTDVDDMATTVSVVEDDATLVTDDGTFTFYDLQGDTVVRRVHFEGNIPDGSGVERAAAEIGARENPRAELSVRVDGYATRTELEPGDRVWVYDPEVEMVNTLVSPFGDEVYYRGQIMHPERAFIEGVNWPVQRGMGVYMVLLTDNTADQEIIDLTRYVDWEEGPTELEIGALRRIARAVAA